ncbi:CBM9 family sugar-binding protein [Thalassotalea sp. 1_MG-2023]|uniref:CBM9 family sugar-binding protein n=1 Tax=Thalassotalea sp. 1_MG-2023 TaxID=3062680 RepID=UPI0026E2B428|nr:CBM9 family sugar-binding protein [Thalassotalea sp. 1_MG-2023]MDO6428544.1 CBM9 family sugar-binding protein [Thalassotalea sp. 1_MG-2023]
MKHHILLYLALCITSLLINNNAYAQTIKVHKTMLTPKIDGEIDTEIWSAASWQGMNHLMLGEMPNKSDFQGRFKLLWNNSTLFILAEITDDVLFDQHADPLYFYWDDDCLEVFIDEDASGGDHQYSFNAFAYHIALDNQVVDIASKLPNGQPSFVTLNDHIKSRWKRSKTKPYNVIWELAISIYDDKFTLEERHNYPSVELTEGKVIGFMLAYCDNDGSKQREHFIGSTDIEPVNGSKNLGYITADVFDKLLLIE